MSGYFEADWLTLREPADRSARPESLLLRLQQWSADHQQLRITDLGSGTGSNPRYLAPALPSRQHWQLVDHDHKLLQQAETALTGLRDAMGHPVRISTLGASLSDPAALLADAPDLVTASALLDLVSEDWLRQLASACRQAKATVLFALSYDGDIQWQPADPWNDPWDTQVRQAVNAHQTRDKGLGPALGPNAAASAARAFRAEGYSVELAPSPWRIGPDQAALQAALLDGWVSAAIEQEPDQQTAFTAWARRRLALIRPETGPEIGDSHILVGHQDLFATPVDYGTQG